MDEQTPNIIPPPILQEEPQKSKQLTMLIASVLVGIVVIVGGYFIYQKLSTKSQIQKADSLNVATTTDQFAGWKTYKNDKYRFELKIPSDWYIGSQYEATGPWKFQNVPLDQYVYGLGIPSKGNMWINIIKRLCNDPTVDFVNNDSDPKASTEFHTSIKGACQNGFEISLGLWQTDSEFTTHKALLNQVLSTFKYTEPSTPINYANFELQIKTALDKMLSQSAPKNVGIPKGSKLLSAQVLENTIILNFNKEIISSSDPWNFEGILGLIDQAIGPTINKIKSETKYTELHLNILIEGEEVDGRLI